MQRNFGIEKAVGEYILFIDSDDYIDEKFIYFASKNFFKYDTIIPIYIKCYYAGKYLINKKKCVFIGAPTISKNNFFLYTGSDLCLSMKFYKRNILKKIRFPSNLCYGEDFVFNFFLYSKKHSCYCEKRCIYYHTRNVFNYEDGKYKKREILNFLYYLLSIKKDILKTPLDNYKGFLHKFNCIYNLLQNFHWILPINSKSFFVRTFYETQKHNSLIKKIVFLFCPLITSTLLKHRIKGKISKNFYHIKSIKNKINLFYWKRSGEKKNNFGDNLAPIIYKFMCNMYSLNINKNFKQTLYLSTIGSIIGASKYNLIIWGSGILNESFVRRLQIFRKIKFDIRIVRGPITEFYLKRLGYKTNGLYGDPAVLMPLIFNKKIEKKYNISFILHFSDKRKVPSYCHKISVEKNNPLDIIREIISSKLIISSSLHGLIIAESYGVPSIWLRTNKQDDFKYYDWYFSIGKKENEISVADSIKESLLLKPMKSNALIIKNMQKKLIETFPFDIWNN